jgi:hypothetical protein
VESVAKEVDQGGIAAAGVGEAFQVSIRKPAVEVVVKGLCVLPGFFEIVPVGLRPGAYLGIEILKRFVQFVAGIFRPIRADSCNLGVGMEEVADIGVMVLPDAIAREAPGVGHTVFRDVPVRQARDVLPPEAWRLNGADL